LQTGGHAIDKQRVAGGWQHHGILMGARSHGDVNPSEPERRFFRDEKPPFSDACVTQLTFFRWQRGYVVNV
jgi:hypothetical protein